MGYAGATYVNSNAYYNLGWKYKTTAPAAVLQVGGSSQELTFRQAVSGTAGNAITYTQPFTINTSGNVGIGVTSPVGKLQVSLPTYTNEDTNSQQAIFGVDSGYGVRIGYNETDNKGYINVLKPGVAWGSLILQEDIGKVGIGTTSPSEILQTNKNSAGNIVGGYFTNSQANTGAESVSLAFGLNRSGGDFVRQVKAITFGAEQQWTGTPSTVDGYLAFSTVSNETVSERMRIFSNGNVNIGVAEAGASTVTGPFVVTHTSSRFLTSSYEESAVSLSAKNGNNNLETLRLAGDSIKFFNGTNAVGSQKMVILNSGNVGIGTTSPNYPLDIQSTVTGLTSNLKVNKSSTTGDYAEIAFQLWSGAGSGLNTFGGSGTSRPSVVLRAINENANSAAGAFVVGTFEGGATNSTLTEKFRINSTGSVGIGVTNIAAKLEVLKNGDNGSGGNNDYGILTTSNATSSQATLGAVHSTTGYANLNLGNNDGGLKFWHISKRLSSDSHRLEYFYYDSGFSSKFIFETNGTFTAVGDIVAYSDKRLKSNIKTLDGSKVYKMRGVSFIKDNKKGSGVIAQEMQKIAPELVNDGSEYLGVAYGNISGYLIEAIKELKAEIEELKSNKCNCNK